MHTTSQVQLAAIREKLAHRDVYLWGIRQAGLSMCRVLERMGCPAVGFIDSSPAVTGETVLGLPVLAPGAVLSRRQDKPFILLTSGFYGDEIAAICEDAGFDWGEDFVSFTEIQRFDYQIDIAGLCNLRCISCPRGNFPEQPPAGFMSAADYERVLDKILREDPFVGAVALYNWGEPLLNPEVAEIVALTNERGVHAAISSNLNVRKDFSDVIRARPTWFRVSTSGFGDSYEVTHTGGKWARFYENMFTLKRLRERYHPEMIVEVFYHIYGHNRDDYPKMAELCDELGFSLRFRHAAIAPLDHVEAFIEGRELPAEARRTMELQHLKLSEAVELARQRKDRECFYERCLWITWDRQVSQCMEWYDPRLKLVPGDFLSTPIDEIVEARRTSLHCARCKERALHQCFMIYGDEKLVHERQSVRIG